jgi:hypothetical protein
MDLTTQFDKRLESLHTARACPTSEIDAAVVTFERLKTAQSICASLIVDIVNQATLMAVFSELCAEARHGQGTRTPE